MNDPHDHPATLAAVVGAIVATTARLLPEVVDITFIPAVAALCSGIGVTVAIVAGRRAVVGAKIGAAAGAASGLVVYVLALLGLA